MADAAGQEQPDRMNDVANDLAKLVVQEREKRRRAEDTASELAILLVREQHELEVERTARQEAEAQAQELSTLILGDAPREPTRFVPARTRLRSVS
jgi:hypothetical protein